MVTGVADVLMALGLAGRGWASSPGAGVGEKEKECDLERRILGFLSAERHVNDIAVSLDVPVPELFPRLLDMEFQKMIQRGRGDYYRKTSKSGTPAREGV
jgi:predicted Rossmann fold nucleotide-binding protein DprA/Smf involved in DNA uptake